MELKHAYACAYETGSIRDIVTGQRRRIMLIGGVRCSKGGLWAAIGVTITVGPDVTDGGIK